MAGNSSEMLTSYSVEKVRLSSLAPADTTFFPEQITCTNIFEGNSVKK